MTPLADVLTVLLDGGRLDHLPVPGRTYSGEYREELARAAARSGQDESVQVGVGRVAGRPVVVIAGEFGFLAGSVGHTAADRVVAGYRHATEHRLPVITLPTSGGTRMQEGTAAFVRMADIARAAAEHRAVGAVRIGWLRDPTTGGVMATWGSYADITASEPGALLGFLGPRVFAALYDRPFPGDVQTAENLRRVGIIDAVVALPDLRRWTEDVLAACSDDEPRPAAPPTGDVTAVDSWECVLRSRRPDRPGPQEVVARLDRATRLSGTQAGEVGKGVTVTIGRLLGRRAVVVAQNRREVVPADLRLAQRGIALAGRLGLPIVTLVDTPGGELSVAAEESAMAGEIARTLAALTTVSVPTVSCVMGQGCGGAALALVPAGRVLCAQYGWISPLPPEGASVISRRTAEHADEMARIQGVGSTALRAAGIVDVVIPEGDDLVNAVLHATAVALDEVTG